MDTKDWLSAQVFEKNWWGLCLDTINEEIKQRTYGNRMGLTPYQYNLQGKHVIDFGGGVVSMLLKYQNRGICYVVDPLPMPNWVKARYQENDIQLFNVKAEDYDSTLNVFDEAWIYNCLQHTDNAKKVAKKAMASAKIVRVFEWIDTGTAPGHIHDLKEAELNQWFRGTGKVEQINENYCHGKCYYGVFKGDLYEG